MRLDLNADLGESYGAWTLGDDPALLESVTSASVACGFHAGDPPTIRRAVRLAARAGVAVGAHPSFPDRSGFGRREMAVDPGELEDLVLYQVAAVAGIAAAEGVALQHVKAHGALYNLASRDRRAAAALVAAVAAFDRSLLLFVPAGGGSMLEAAGEAGLTIVREAFADRAYLADGSLVPRGRPGALLTDPRAVLARVVRMVRQGLVATLEDADLPLAVDTVCLHGDTPGAPGLARMLRAGLAREGIDVRAFRPPGVDPGPARR